MKSGYRMFIVTGAGDFDRLLKEIHSLFPLQEEAAFDIDEWYMDTFDWRLCSKGFVFRKTDGRFVLASLSGNLQEETEGPQKPKLFWQDFPEGAVRDRLADISGVRALCPLFRVVGRRRHFRLYNKDEKTVLRLRLETGDLYRGDEKRGAFPPCLHLEGIRGYYNPFQRLSEELKAKGCRELEAGETFFDLFLRQLQMRPDCKKTQFFFGAGQTTNQAISSIGLALLDAMQRNLPGVIDDIDPEFLHDFRVSIRRTRALLSQFKNEIPPGQTGIFQKEFQWLGTVAGPVRDLDVCLQKEENYRLLLQEGLHPGLSLLMEKIAELRKGQWLIMRDHLRSSRTGDLFVNWQDFLTSLPIRIQTPPGQAPCRKAARKVVRRCFQRLIKDAAAVTKGENQDISMHKLRIQAKKFRYMAEFFRSFFSPADMDILVGELRGLQDELGDFNDLAVQIRRFQDYKAALSLEQAAGEALDELLLRLADERKRLLKRCLKRCGKFTKNDRNHLF